MTLSLFDRPAVLFLPASRASAIDKARSSAADLVILDLEDAVRPDDKDSARAGAVAAISQDWPMPVAIRINGVGSDWHGADLAAVLPLIGTPIVLPSVRRLDELRGASSVIGRPLITMVETAEAVLNLRELSAHSAGLIVGTNDLAADLRLPGVDRSAMSYALQATLLAARAARIPVFDGVFNRLDDPAGFAAEAATSRALGFDGKSLIHPDQIAACHAAFAPSADELARAHRLVAAATDGATRFEDEMVEAMHVAAARRLIERYGSR